MSASSVQDQLLTLLLNSKKGDNLPVIDSLENTDKIIVFDISSGLVSTILKSNLVITGGSGTSSKIPVTIDNDKQANYTITSKPDNVNLIIGRVPQHQDTDYSYDNQTGALVITNTSVINSIKTTSLFDLRGFQNSLSKKENLVIPLAKHATYNLSEKPKSVDVVLDRTILSEDTDYTYNNSTGDLNIIKPFYINGITLNSILEVRKIY